MAKSATKKSTATKKKTTKSSKSTATKKAPAKKKKTAKAKTRVKKEKPAISAKKRKASARGECQVEACKQPVRAKKYCQSHYKKWRRGGFGTARYKACHATDCHAPMAQSRRGYCEEHYQVHCVKKTGAPRAAEEQVQQAEAS